MISLRDERSLRMCIPLQHHFYSQGDPLVFGEAEIPPRVPLTGGRGKNDEPEGGLISESDACDSVLDDDCRP